MHGFRSVHLFSLLGFALLVFGQPASARRTVYDLGSMSVGDYCAPGVVGTSDCSPQALPFNINIGGTTYNSFVLNGNGTLSLGAAVDWSITTGKLSDYGIPVFSPEIDNTTAVYPDYIDQFGNQIYTVDTRWSAIVTTTSNSLTAEWFPCSSMFFCGPLSFPADLSDELGILTLDQIVALQNAGIFYLTLTDTSSGFEASYSYNPGGDSTGSYGYYLPGEGSFQTTGPLHDQSFLFNSLGQLVPVPEPTTWMTMLLGFGLVGFVVRRQRERQPKPA